MRKNTRALGWWLSVLGLYACGTDPLGNQRPESARIPKRVPISSAANGGGSGTGGGALFGGAGNINAGADGAAGTNPGFSGSGGSVASREPFSFFVTSYAAMQRLATTPNGFGGDLRYGEPDGLAGADKICAEIAESSMPGASAKGWRAFLSVTKGPGGQPVHAIDRVGDGPWYDRLGRLIALTRADLLNPRPNGADPAIINDLPNEAGIPNHAPDGTTQVDNHDFLTGTNNVGQLFSSDWKFTCHDWTSSAGADGTPRVGHAWPRMGVGTGGAGTARAGTGGTGAARAGTGGTGAARAGTGGGFLSGGRGSFPVAGSRAVPIAGSRAVPVAGSRAVPVAGSRAVPIAGTSAFAGGIDTTNWMSALTEAGCAAGASLIEMGPPNPQNPTVGSGGGYGGIYCFALTP
jgi:hypothetical protein